MNNFLITGRPGVGKTTIIRKVADHFPGQARGFYTSEIRVAGKRKGFSITTLSGEQGILAHTDVPSPYRVGRYHVLVADFELIAVAPLYRDLSQTGLFIIDEIGKMELFSARFVELITTILDFPIPVVATIMQHPNPIADQIKRRNDVQIFPVNESNREELPSLLIQKVEPYIQNGSGFF